MTSRRTADRQTGARCLGLGWLLCVCMALMLALPTRSVWACSCGYETAQQDFDEADAVYSGRVLAAGSAYGLPWSPPGGFEKLAKGWIAETIAVNHVWKGLIRPTETVLVNIEGYSGECDRGLGIGGSYLIYARQIRRDRMRLGFGQFFADLANAPPSESISWLRVMADDSYETSTCLGTHLLLDDDEDLKTLGPAWSIGKLSWVSVALLSLGLGLRLLNRRRAKAGTVQRTG
jgi:hypothetical protein